MRSASFLLVVGLVVVSMGLSPAKADLFGFTISNPETTFDGSSQFQVSTWAGTTSHLYRNDVPFDVSSALLVPATSGAGGFSMSMTLTNITATTADGAGTFWFKDIDGDMVSGDISGTWQLKGSAGNFDGTFSNVVYTPVASGSNTFDGNIQAGVSMIFDAPTPWAGGFTLLTAGGTWFVPGSEYSVRGGSMDATVTPIPAALVIGMLGMGVAGLKLRKFA